MKKTKSGGTIILLESNETDEVNKTCSKVYGKDIVINKSVTIKAESSLSDKPCFYLYDSGNNQSDSAFVVKAEDNKHSVTVRLQGLRFISDRGFVGVSFISGSALKIEKCDFNNLNHGIVFAGAGSLSVKDSDFSATLGIWIENNDNEISASIKNCKFTGSGTAWKFESKNFGNNQIKVE